MTPTPHDALVRAIFGQPHYAADELRATLPAEVLAELRLESLAPIGGSFVDEALRASCADLLFSVELRRGGSGLVYLLFEHQSTPDAAMPLRLLRYQTRIFERCAAESSEARALPPIVSLLLHHGPRPWPWPPRFTSQVAVDEEARAAFGRRLLDFEFVLDDLATQSDAQLLGRASDAVVRLTLLALRNGRDVPDFASHLAVVLAALREDLRGPAVVPALATLMRYVLEVGDSPPEVVRSTFAAALAPQIRSDVMTTADMLRAEGRVEGRAEGQIEARRESLLDLLAIKFGAVDAATRARIDRASNEQLVAWLRRFVSASSLATVFGE